jgi:hypothetical protein
MTSLALPANVERSQHEVLPGGSYDSCTIKELKVFLDLPEIDVLGIVARHYRSYYSLQDISGGNTWSVHS